MARNPSTQEPVRANRRLPRKATPKRLARAAWSYLDRYAASSGQLRRVLLAKVERSARIHDTDREEGAAAVEEIIARAQDQGLLNDRAYGEAKAASLHRRGQSAKAIAAYLRGKGLLQEDIQHALEQLQSRVGESEIIAATTYCRKRRIGPHRPADERAAMRDKDLAALARRGFSYGIACKVIDEET